MDNKKISQLTDYTTPQSSDVLPIVDNSTVITKKISWSNMLSAIQSAISSIFVPLTRTINGKALSSDITLNYTDVNAVPYTGATNSLNLGANSIIANSVKLNTTGVTPTVSGETFWDNTNKTLAVKLDANSTLQVGQEMLDYVYNGTGSTILNGKIVYQSGVQGTFPSVSLAMANNPTTANVMGMATEDIPTGTYGYITNFGTVNGLDTSSYSPNTPVFLSDSVPGGITSTPPQLAIQVGTVEYSNATTGSIRIRVNSSRSLNSLTDVTISSPTTGQFLSYNGTDWVNAAGATASAGPGVGFYNDNTSIIGTGTNNVNPVDTLSRYPVTTTEIVDTYNVNNNTIFGEAYSDGVLGRTSVDAGTWTFNTWCGVNSTTGGRISSLTRTIHQIIQGSGTITTTGTGTTRTATVTGGTPFISGDVNTDITSASYLQTPQGLYRITAYTSSSVVSIEVPSTYANETGASYWKWAKLFSVNTGNITFLSPNYGLIQQSVAQPAFTINATDKIGCIVFATSNNTTSVYFLHNGNNRYSYFTSPLVTSHQDLAILQGGNATERYHLSLAQATSATRYANGSQDGLISSTDWTTFNNKQPAGSYVTSGGALGTPSSGTLTNCTGLPVAGITASTTQALGVGSIELGHASDTTIARSAAGQITVEGVQVDTVSNAVTLTNKRIQPRVYSTTTTATLAPDLSSYSLYYLTAQTGTLAISAPIGTPVVGETIIINIYTASAQTLSPNVIFKAMGTAFPASTTAGKKMVITAQYDGTDWISTWAIQV